MKRSIETRLKISNSMKGKIPWNKGKSNIYSKNTIEKIRQSLIGKKIKEETKKKISISLSGRKQTIEHRENNRASQVKRFPNYELNGRKNRRKRNLIKNGGHHTNGEWENLKAQYNWKCPCCNKSEPIINLTRDHIIPISKGGSDNIENIQPLCKSCNSIKHTNTIKY